jgi:diguanylate cyclase (GGDEF)-like protein
MNHLPQSSILIVDDNPINIKVLWRFLKSVGYRVLTASDGTNALEQVKNFPVDLIILDVMLPDLCGFEVCKSLQRDEKTQNIPIIFITSLNDTESKIQAFSLGAVDFICQPFIQEELLARVKLHLDLHHLQKTLEEQNQRLREEITSRNRIEEELLQLNQELERRVIDRTAELTHTLLELKNTQAQLIAREVRLQYDAFHDKLTDLPNRSLFIEYLTQEIQIAQENTDYLYAVLFIDLDGFKSINDNLGHLRGDKLLRLVAKRLKKSIRELDTVARFGGDEFAVLLRNLSHINESKYIAQRILNNLGKKFSVDGEEVQIGASIGIAPGLNTYQHPEKIIDDADTAMYHAKNLGKGCQVLFNSTSLVSKSKSPSG